MFQGGKTRAGGREISLFLAVQAPYIPYPWSLADAVLCAGGADPVRVPSEGGGPEEGDVQDAEGDGPRAQAGDT